jgi:hypothetical protein
MARGWIRVHFPGLRFNWWVLAALMLIGASAMLPVIQTSSATTTGHGIQVLESQRAELRSEIAVLEADIAGMRSMDRIEQRARELGLHPANDPYYVEIETPGPYRARVPAQYQPDPIPQPQEDTAWWIDLLNGLGLPFH